METVKAVSMECSWWTGWARKDVSLFNCSRCLPWLQALQPKRAAADVLDLTVGKFPGMWIKLTRAHDATGCQDWLWNCSKTLGHYQWFCCSWVWPSNSANISAPNMCHAYAESAQQYFPILHITSACACSLRANCSCKRDKSCSPWPAIERSWHRSDFAINSVGVRTKTMQVRKITAVLRIKPRFVKVFEIIEGAHTVISGMWCSIYN